MGLVQTGRRGQLISETAADENNAAAETGVEADNIESLGIDQELR
jgi:hypothetical protein